MTERLIVIYAIDRRWLTGDAPRDAPSNRESYLAWHATLPAIPVLTMDEMAHVLYSWRLVPHSTYSMQQSDFGRAGLPVTTEPWKVCLPTGTLVVGLGTRDRYDIFDDTEAHEVVTYETVEEWRAQRDLEQEGWPRVATGKSGR